MSQYRILVDNDVRMTFSANFSQASDPILLEGSSTPFQVADARHSPELAAEKLITWCESQGGSNVGEDEEYDVVAVDEALEAMAAMLNRHGDTYAGNHVEETAQDWLDHGFDADTADDWCEIGCWDAATAAEFRDAGKTPDQIKAASERLAEEAGDEVADEYTDGDPIYAACNCDISANVLIEACE